MHSDPLVDPVHWLSMGKAPMDILEKGAIACPPWLTALTLVGMASVGVRDNGLECAAMGGIVDHYLFQDYKRLTRKIERE